MKKSIVLSLTVLLAGGAIAAEAQDMLEIKGDVRYRHETIGERNRHRVRARAQVDGVPSESVSATIGLCSGGSDPVSSNQTLDEGFTSKGINLDLAFIDLHPASMPGLALVAGKMKNPFESDGDLIWDGDLRPEGLALCYKAGNDTVSVMAKAAGMWVEERRSAADTMLYAGRLGADFDLDAVSLLVGAGYYAYANLQGQDLLIAPLDEASQEYDSFGNSVAESTEATTGPDGMPAEQIVSATYAAGFEDVEGFMALEGKAGDVGLKLYANYVMNLAAAANNTGYLAGLTISPKPFKLDYNYRVLQADAAVGAFADSDSFGGGTDGQGHRISASYALAKNVTLGATYFINEINLSEGGEEYTRLQLDIAAKF